MPDHRQVPQVAERTEDDGRPRPRSVAESQRRSHHHDDDQDHRGRTAQPGQHRADPGQQPSSLQHADQRPRRKCAEQRLGVGHRQDDAHRRCGEQNGEQQPSPTRIGLDAHHLAVVVPVDVLGKPSGEACGHEPGLVFPVLHLCGAQRSDPGDTHRGQAPEHHVHGEGGTQRTEAGHLVQRPGEQRIAGEERVGRVGVAHTLRVGLGQRHAAVPVLGDGEHPFAVPRRECRAEVAAAQLREPLQHEHADQTDEEEGGDRLDPVTPSIQEVADGFESCSGQHLSDPSAERSLGAGAVGRTADPPVPKHAKAIAACPPEPRWAAVSRLDGAATRLHVGELRVAILARGGRQSCTVARSLILKVRSS